MIIGKLINPQIIYKDGQKHSFSNDLVLEQDGIEIERRPISLPYNMPDPEIEILVKNMVVQKQQDIAYAEAYAIHANTQRELNPSISDEDIIATFTFEPPIIEPQEVLQWDWPLFDEEGA